jgi:rapamycin-insensitive companion of mTOR
MKFARVPPNKQVSSEQAERFKKAATDPDRINARILQSIVEMGNLVMYKKAAGELRLLKERHPEAFKQVPLFQKTLIILESHHFRLQPKQFVLDLFGKGVMRQLVLEEDSEEDLTGSDTG